jgi:hypothetical protein
MDRSNQLGASREDSFLFFNVAARLATFGLVEHAKTPASAAWQRLKLSQPGVRFLTRARLGAAQKIQLQASPLVSKTTGVEKAAGVSPPPSSKRRAEGQKTSTRKKGKSS